MIKLLHIPKTAGTALRNTLKSDSDLSIETSHTVTLLNTKAPEVGFVLRDPVDRFCSGFWECYRKPQTGRSYLNYEAEIFKHCNTPNDLLETIKHNQSLLDMFKNISAISPDGGLIKMMGSYTYWLGSISKYKELEKKVKIVLNTDTLTQSLRDLYNIEITSDAKQSRSREQFNISQSYEVSSDNREWFANTFRPEDYELMDYISQREYYK